MLLAERLMHTCYSMYAQTPTGLAPEIVIFNPQQPGYPKEHVVRASNPGIQPRDCQAATGRCSVLLQLTACQCLLCIDAIAACKADESECARK
jgi:Glycosyl hydrolase family 47